VITNPCIASSSASVDGDREPAESGLQQKPLV